MTFSTHTGSKSSSFGPIGKYLFAAALAATPMVAYGQEPRDTELDRSGLRTVEIWAGYSDRSPKLGVLGNRAGMSFALGAARFTQRVRTRPGYALDYTFDLIPLALVSPPLQLIREQEDTGAYLSQTAAPVQPSAQCAFSDVPCHFPEGSARGFGISPIGFTALYRRDRALQFRLGGTGGALYFDRAVPTVISARFNFTATVEAGAQLVDSQGRGVLLVYRFHHLSNAGTAYDNSAIASNVISLGARWRRDRD